MDQCQCGSRSKISRRIEWVLFSCIALAMPSGCSRTAPVEGGASIAVTSAKPVALAQATDGDSGPGDANRRDEAVVAEPKDEAAFLFDQSAIRTFDVDIDPADLARADADPAAEQYVPARLRFEGQTYDVGYRYKGSLGAFFPPCTDLLSGKKQGKCSVKISFDFVNADAKFHGLKKLLFHAMNNDPSMLRERLGYSLYREMGVPGPRANHAILRVNGKANLYAFVEEVDGRFTRNRFREGGKGNLYKEIWPVSDDPKAYVAALESNKKEGTADRMLRFSKALASRPDAVQTWMDAEITTSYLAVDRVIMNDDGPLHFYCFAGAIGNNPKAPGNHNYYWYEAEKSDRVWLIPWDLDLAINDKTNPPHLPTDWRKPASGNACNVCGGPFGALGSNGPAPGCDRVVQGWQKWLAQYESQVDRFLTGPFSKEAVDAKLDTWKRQMAAAGFPAQEAAVTTLREILDRARANRGFKY